MSTAARFNEGKPELDQILWFAPALRALSRHASAGRRKYPDREGVNGERIPNWLLGGKPDEEYIAAAMRHLTAMVYDGELYDTETETLHAAAVMWNMAALITCNYTSEDGAS